MAFEGRRREMSFTVFLSYSKADKSGTLDIRISVSPRCSRYDDFVVSVGPTLPVIYSTHYDVDYPGGLS
jgi:hypothetical protein